MSLWSEKSHNKYTLCLIIVKFLFSSESLLSALLLSGDPQENNSGQEE